jgi:hypothetical protein
MRAQVALKSATENNELSSSWSEGATPVEN